MGSVISHGEGNYESYNTGTKNVKGDKVGYSFKNPGKGTVTSKRIQQIIDNAEAKDGNDKNRLFATGKYQTTYYTLQEGLNRDILLEVKYMMQICKNRYFENF